MMPLLLPLILSVSYNLTDSLPDIEADSVPLPVEKTVPGHWGYAIDGYYGIVPKGDKEIKRIVKDNKTWTVGAQLRYTGLPSDGNPYDEDYNYPTFSLGLAYHHYQDVSFHRDLGNYDFGLAQPVDYMSYLGDIVTLYGAFDRPILRHPRKWQFDYSLQFGLGYTGKKYNPYNNVDNEMISSNVLIYCGLGLHAVYSLTPELGLRTGIEFQHHSNGALCRPNKGSNTIGPMVGLVYRPAVAAKKTEEDVMTKGKNNGTDNTDEDAYHYDYLNVAFGVGAKALYEDWVKTQFETAPGEPGYRTDRFKTYMEYSLNMDYMRRWARRWATGAGVDVFYGSHIDHVRDLDIADDVVKEYSPWTLAFSVKHEAYYRRLTCAMSFGLYLYRHMGHNARRVEQPFYETIGVRYNTHLLDGLQVGFFVKAHAFKADFTGLVVSTPIRLKKPLLFKPKR